jgi:NAD(P)-dependent dehydrogenase (short-subunit alcohol dehydrogenase family)
MTSQQTILIAGATGNIGRATTVALAKRGARVVMLGRSADKLESKVDQIRNELSEAQIEIQDTDIATLVVDFADMDSVKLAAAEAMKRFARIDCLVLSVGSLIQGGPNILPSGHEVMFATNVLGPFLFTELLLGRLEESDGLVVHVIAPFKKAIDWDDLQSIRNHKPMTAFNRDKVFNRMISRETARRYAGRISSLAFDPAYVIDKTDPELKERWPSGFIGFIWWVMTILFAKSPTIAGEPMADLILSHQDRSELNGALFKLDRRVTRPDKAMGDEVSGKRLWEALVLLAGLGTASATDSIEDR